MAESSSASMNHMRAVLDNDQTPAVNKRGLSPKQAQLQKRDSGYNSPVTPGTTPDSTNPSKAKTLHLGAQPSRSVSSPSALPDYPEKDMQKSVQPNVQVMTPGKSGILKRQLSSPGALDASQPEQFLHLASGTVYSQFNLSQRMVLGQQESQSQPSFSCDGSSVLFLAYKCKELNPMAWNNCKHPYCVMVRNNLTHMRSCYAGSGECKRCQQFDNHMYRHAETCTLLSCPVDMCRNTKQQLQQEMGSLPYDYNNPFVPLQRRNSFGGSDQYYGNTNQSSLLFSFSQFESASISEDSPAARYIGARADEIVKKMDSEEPLLPPEPPSTAPPTSLGRPASLLRSNTAPNEDYQVNMLSPIAEAESPSFGPPHLMGGDTSMHSMGLMSSELDGLKHGANSLVVEGEEPEYPEQKVMHKITCDTLTVGSDGHYYQFRDYNANDNMIKDGGFGSVRFAEDLSSNHLFAIKCNKRDDDSIIESIETEARLLSRLGPHINVIQMYGAVLDCQEHEFLPTRMYKLLMELSQHGNLAEMVVDPDTSEPLPLDRDQALFYFWQVLKGVDFLHKNNVLHLDIKGSNILVFDEGRTLKICDFGTAVSVDEVASQVGKNLGTVQFSAPEICRQEMPHFSSDMWSTMCVLVEILTGKTPWHSFSNTLNCLIYKIGWYKDEQMETELLPPGAEIDADLVDLMRSVFHAEGKERASASQLLQHPLIVSAYTYEACFDEVLEEDDAPMEDDCAPVDEEVGYVSHASCAPSSLTLALNPPDYTLPGHLLEGQADMKRLSKDSGTADLDQDIAVSYGRMSSCGRGSDSGLDTPYTADRLILSSGKFTFATHPEENSAEMMESADYPDRPILSRSHLFPPHTPSEGAYKSLPDPVLTSDPVAEVQRSFSLGSHSLSFPYQAPVGSTNGSLVPQKRQHPCPWSYSRLRHSNSAPIIGDDRRRRLSLQSLRSYGTDEHSNGKLRRISSEIYVDRGPDIDSPDRVRTLEDVSSWAQNVQKEFSLPSDEQECDPLAAGHTPSAEDGPLTMPMLSKRRTEDRNCISAVDDAQGFRVQMVKGGNPQVGVARAESASGAEASRTEVEKHVTTQGRTFDVYKTVC